MKHACNENKQLWKVLPENFKLNNVMVNSETKTHKSWAERQTGHRQKCIHEQENAKIEYIKGKFGNIGNQLR